MVELVMNCYLEDSDQPSIIIVYTQSVEEHAV